jgi:hypothetical protein
MPQPIRQICRFEFSGLTNRPQHAKVLGQIIAISGVLESRLGWILALLSRGSASITVSMFHSVVSTDAQKAMLLAAAEQALAKSELDAFKELLEDFRPRYGERSKLVHNLWGHSDDHPDKALWCRSSDAAFAVAKFAAANDQVAFNNAVASDDLALQCMAYTVKDLENVAARLQEYTDRVTAFWFDLMNNHPALVAATTSATSAKPRTSEPQLDLHQRPQTDPK